MKCKKCKREIPDNSIYCNWCGAEQLKPHKKDEIKIPTPVRLESGNYFMRLRKEGQSGTFATQEEAVAWAKAVRAGFIEAQSAAAKSNSKLTVAAWADQWLDTYIKPRIREVGAEKKKGTMSKKSYNMYPQKIDGYIIPAIGNKLMADVIDSDLQKIMNSQVGTSHSHCQKLRIVIQKLFSQATASRLIPFDPSLQITLPATTEGRRRSLTVEERAVLLKVAKTHSSGLWIRFLLDTGLRTGESAAIKWGDLDPDTKMLKVATAVESGTKVIGTPKSRAGKRFVPVPNQLFNELNALRGEDESFIFTQKNGTMMTQTVITRYWKSFAYQMDLELGAEHTSHGHIYDPSDLYDDGKPMYPDPSNPDIPRNGHKLAPDLCLHCLRHTYCTDLKAAGVPVDVAKDLMGHEDITMTANIYADADIESIINAAALINDHKA